LLLLHLLLLEKDLVSEVLLLLESLHLHQLHLDLNLHGLGFRGSSWSSTLLSDHSSDLCLSLKQGDLLLLLLLESSGNQLGVGRERCTASSVQAHSAKSVNKLSGLIHVARLEGVRGEAGLSRVSGEGRIAEGGWAGSASAKALKELSAIHSLVGERRRKTNG
jgi:hypothetical protein